MNVYSPFILRFYYAHLVNNYAPFASSFSFYNCWAWSGRENLIFVKEDDDLVISFCYLSRSIGMRKNRVIFFVFSLREQR